jgi:hypothetical protein
MSWGAQSRSKDAKTPSAGRGMSENPELDCCPVQPCPSIASTAVLLTKPQIPKANTRLQHDCTTHTRQSQSRDKAEWVVVVGDGRNLLGSLNQRKSEAARQAPPPARLHNTNVQAFLLAHKCRGRINRTNMTDRSFWPVFCCRCRKCCLREAMAMTKSVSQ